MNITEITNDEFREFTNNFSLYSPYQTAEYASLLTKSESESIILGLKDNGILVGASVIFISKGKKYKYAYAPKGFLIDYRDSNILTIFTNEIKKYLNKLDVVSIKINPMIVKNSYDKRSGKATTNEDFKIIFNNLKTLGYKHNGYTSYFEGLTPRFDAYINLAKPYYMIFNDFNKEVRTKIRSASKKGIDVYIGSLEEVKILYKQMKNKYQKDLTYLTNIYNCFHKNNNVDVFYTKFDPAKYLKYTQDEYNEQYKVVNDLLHKIKKIENRSEFMKDKIEADKILEEKKKELVKASNLTSKYPDGVVTATALIIKGKKQVNLFMDGYLKELKSFNSKHLLIWKLCEKYSNEGYDLFNLGPISDITLKDNLYKGLNDFKLSFHAIAIEYIGDLDLIINKSKYLIETNMVFKKK